ncbi:beta strand repeat-containing protein [Sphingomonas solaris]|uniref:Curlin associated protein n=1 Tax=Alterirhizorhabdus solaris TaxID=2529389 RepID=A0A558RA23_9SPHN|nr:hypothetical protein [Sphingomonas solaris]TVV76224.1 hypothetical protein FOY91_04785 [Sphingomonas solaris]
MKRTILASVSFAAMILSAGPAMAAGSNSTVNQNGTLQAAVIRQETATNAKSTVTQSGTDNAFNILQEGTGNTSTATQAGADVRPGNVNSNAPKTSGGYIANNEQKSNFGNVIQRGTGGTSTLNQTNNNRALIEQTSTSTDAVSDVTQNQPAVGDSFNPRDYQNSADVTQAGNGRVTVNQNGNPAGAANGNTAFATQDASTLGATSEITQYGRNLATTRQSGASSYSSVAQGRAGLSSGDNVADVTQDGDSDSFITQSDGDNSSAFVNQSGGSFNLSVVNQSKGTGAILSTVDVRQIGSDNRSGATQTGQGANATVRQTQTLGASNGDRSNLSSIEQVAFSTATVTQTGDENDSYLTQSSSNGATGSTATVTQDGQRNASGINQSASGTSNTATVAQTGTDQGSSLTQNSTDSAATITQSASFNQSFAVQSGTQQTLFVSQTGSDNMSGVDQSGSNNYASVSQTTNNNVNSLTQGGSFNTAFVTQ